MSAHDLELKMKNFEIKFQDQADMFNSIKKDLFAEIYDYNQKSNNKFQMVNETIVEKLDKYDVSFTNFQNILVNEHEKFSQFICEQIDMHNSNLKKSIEYNVEDIKMINENFSEKIYKLEEVIRNLRTDVFNNLNEAEEFLTKKYDNLLRNYNDLSCKVKFA